MPISPLKRALRNSIMISLVVAAVVVYQGKTATDSVLTGLFTFVVTFPALWLSFRYTSNIMAKYQDDARAVEKRTERNTDLHK
ncbi:hypothetical protein QCB44_03850 [Thiomicrorhabdus sp. zzn3]|uniref:hypothetical protein n=1 Tax=Thiomicrorhabdus sp. zzn3 TaxID=3039775 RepID=UPI0024372DE9|nr:hypothetical protein [Thiomicrorhabdus sp. zzn3]MDG6777837.1 hypothetical protein [Thiomicrorhabdus sp. zzn3]